MDIPDPHFKWALLHPNSYGNDIIIDTNSDGEIEYGEAQNISMLTFNGSATLFGNFDLVNIPKIG